MEEVKKDSRFSHIARDPKFRRMRRKDRKVHVDKRFKSMLKKQGFELKESIGKRGEPLKASEKEHLERFYHVDSSDSEDNNEDGGRASTKQQKISEDGGRASTKQQKISEDGGRSSTKQQKISEEHSQADKEGVSELHSDSESSEETEVPDFARGGGNVESSSDEESDSEPSTKEDSIEHEWGEMDKNAPRVEEATSHLALCNMDWDRIKANDILVLVNSVKPTGGVVTSVTIYPSDYGLEMMKEEDLEGPKTLKLESKKYKQDSEEQQQERLRQYQLNRLRYYYAVIECDAKATANAIYEQCDGVEYETSATKLDLRFIPDEMSFDQKPHSVATNIPDGSTYKPSQFRTHAFTHSKVNLTWDETDPERLAVTMRKFTKEDLETMDVHNYLASSSSEEEETQADDKDEVNTQKFEVADSEQKNITKKKKVPTATLR